MIVIALWVPYLATKGIGMSSYEGFLFYHLTMGIALSMISGGDLATSSGGFEG
jgi:hypothetical protein